jgi:hypothetical protein
MIGDDEVWVWGLWPVRDDEKAGAPAEAAQS